MSVIKRWMNALKVCLELPLLEKKERGKKVLNVN